MFRAGSPPRGRRPCSGSAAFDLGREKCENGLGKEMLINHTSKQVTAKIVYYGT